MTKDNLFGVCGEKEYHALQHPPVRGQILAAALAPLLMQPIERPPRVGNPGKTPLTAKQKKSRNNNKAAAISRAKNRKK